MFRGSMDKEKAFERRFHDTSLVRLCRNAARAAAPLLAHTGQRLIMTS